ncbi:flagellar hook-basal body complex protein FliE [uncultured Enterovirga sp.]|uniref:flagellar hook-basal body complex protein FliE n=1 Tax=uncultured Enterovirga sp. TaxID=2026352 RepID=UPI0035CAE1D6
MTSAGFVSGAYTAAQNLMQSRGAPSLGGGSAAGAALGAASGAGGGFGQFLSQAIEGVASSGKAAEAQATSAATGKSNLVDVVTAVAESETALQTLVAVRDRVISAYEEIMRMPI